MKNEDIHKVLVEFNAGMVAAVAGATAGAMSAGKSSGKSFDDNFKTGQKVKISEFVAKAKEAGIKLALKTANKLFNKTVEANFVPTPQMANVEGEVSVSASGKVELFFKDAPEAKYPNFVIVGN